MLVVQMLVPPWTTEGGTALQISPQPSWPRARSSWPGKGESQDAMVAGALKPCFTADHVAKRAYTARGHGDWDLESEQVDRGKKVKATGGPKRVALLFLLGFAWSWRSRTMPCSTA